MDAVDAQVEMLCANGVEMKSENISRFRYRLELRGWDIVEVEQ